MSAELSSYDSEKFMKISSLVEDIKIDLETPLDADDDE